MSRRVLTAARTSSLADEPSPGAVVARAVHGDTAVREAMPSLLSRADGARRVALLQHLQRAGGNRSVAGVVGAARRGAGGTSGLRSVQRCGHGGCDCAPGELAGEASVADVQRSVMTDDGHRADRACGHPVQRVGDDGAAVAPLDPMTLIDPRLDVGAQRALTRLSRDGPDGASAAHEIASAVRTGTLAGVFGDDLGASAALAARLGTVRWELVPQGEDAVLVDEPDRPPPLVFREGARAIPARLDPALVRAWRRQGTPIPPCPAGVESQEDVLAQDPTSGPLLGGAGVCVPTTRTPKPSKVVRGRCEPNKTITGTMFADMADFGTAATMLAGSAAALAAQNITLDITLSMVVPGRDPENSSTIDSDDELCTHVLNVLGPVGLARRSAGVLIVVAPFATPICGGHAEACFMPEFRATCPELPTSPRQLILISPFASTCPETTLAHELGHAAGIGGHRDDARDAGNYMGFTCPRDHFTDEAPPNHDLTKVCAAPLRF